MVEGEPFSQPDGGEFPPINRPITIRIQRQQEKPHNMYRSHLEHTDQEIKESTQLGTTGLPNTQVCTIRQGAKTNQTNT